MQVVFVGDPVELEGGRGWSRQSLDLFGKSFRLGVPVDCSDLSEKQKAQLARHNHFDVLPEPEPEPVAEAASDDEAGAGEAEQTETRRRGKKAAE